MAKLRRFSGTPVSEGVRLEVGKYTVFAVRNMEKDISVRMRREPRKFLRTCMHIPFLRGITRLIRDIIRLFDGLGEAAELKPHRPVRGSAADRAIARFFRVHPQAFVAFTSALLIPLILIAGMYLAPEGAEMILQDCFNLTRAVQNGVVCAVRILGMLVSLACIGRLRVVNRLLMYKGALNKVINCYECRDEITMENAAQYPVHTRRSEAAFVLSVLILSMIIFALVRTEGIIFTLVARIAVILLVAALWNEPFSALEGADMTLPVRIARAPIDLLQHILVLEPQQQMLEVAVCAFEAVLGENNKEVNPD